MLTSQGCCTDQMSYLRKYLALCWNIQLLNKYLSSFLIYPSNISLQGTETHIQTIDINACMQAVPSKTYT